MPTPKRTSDEAVRAATGKTWPEWFKILDDAGSVHRGHKEIARWLADVEKVPPWWSQMVTVEYERARGLRKVHETATGFEVSVQRTIPFPRERVFQAVADAAELGRWLDGDFTERNQKTPSVVRFQLSDGSRLEIHTGPKGPGRTTVSFQHTRLKSSAAVAAWRSTWQRTIDRLIETLT